MLSQFFVRLSQDERAALYKLAAQERRDIRDQAAIIIRQELERRGLLHPEVQPAAEAQPA